MRPCNQCAYFCKRPGGGACLLNPVPRRGVTPGCGKFLSVQTEASWERPLMRVKR